MMARLGQTKELQPSLLDRLTDDDPRSSREVPSSVAFSMGAWRASVLRDLSWLLSATCLEQLQSLDRLPAVRASVVNYGIPPITGRAADALKTRQMEQALRQAIWDFEPRILRESLQVRIVPPAETPQRHCMLFSIEGDLYADPLPLHLALRTEIDLDSGEVTLSDTSGSRVD